MSNLETTLRGISPINQQRLKAAQTHLDALAKPPGSLGALETMAVRLCGIFGEKEPSITRRCILVLAADNGVTEEGVSAAPKEVSAIQTKNIAAGITGVGVLAKVFGADLLVADVGLEGLLDAPGVENHKIRSGTGNIRIAPAMSRAEAIAAIECGIALAERAVEQGYTLLGTGEMGIGNTTTSSSVLCGLLGLSGDAVEKVVGHGAGLSDTAYAHKITVIQEAVARAAVDPLDVVGILAELGGLDIAALCGVFLGGAAKGVPVVVDGFISIVAALCACRLCPTVTQYLFLSHHSFECGYALAAEALGMQAPLHLTMRLGEGSGCPLLFALLDAALAIYRGMATFSDAAIDEEYTGQLDKLSF